MKQLQSPLSWWLRSARVACLAVLLSAGLSGTAHAQVQVQPQPADFLIPPTLLLPNYDRIYPGLTESLEGGAYIARARSAPALFYNPAGIATVERTVLNASAQGYEATVLGGSGFAHTSPISSFTTIPSFVGVVLGKEVIDWDNVRLGFSVSNPVSWDQAAAAGTAPQQGQRVSYSVHSSFKTLVPGASIGWAATPALRFGGSIEFPYTTISDTGQLSGAITSTTTSQGALATLAASGSTLQIRGVGSLQWQANDWLELGFIVRTPGLSILKSGALQYEYLSSLNAGSRQVYFQDTGAAFEYRTPWEAGAGVSFDWGVFGFEVDVRYHSGTHTYTLLGSTKTGTVVDTTSGVPVTTVFALNGVKYRALTVWNGSLGAHLVLTKNFTLSAGSYLDYSPVDSTTTVFRRVDMIGFRTGVSFQIDKVSASVGVGWEHGTGSDDLVPSNVPIPGASSNLTLDTFSLLFSFSFRF
ncbi:MAG: OmpP1/FadL family transporter [Myxococcaceae bacterium]